MGWHQFQQKFINVGEIHPKLGADLETLYMLFTNGTH